MHVIQRHDGRYNFNAGAAANPGDVIVRPCGTLAVLDGLEAIVSGQMISPAPLVETNIVEFDAPSASTWSAGALLYWDNAAKNITTTSAGNTFVGRACRAKTNGQLTNLVNCTAN